MQNKIWAGWLWLSQVGGNQDWTLSLVHISKISYLSELLRYNFLWLLCHTISDCCDLLLTLVKFQNVEKLEVGKLTQGEGALHQIGIVGNFVLYFSETS